MFYCYQLNGRSSEEPVVDARADAEEGNACGTDGQSELGVSIALEGRQRSVSLLDVHGLDDEQVVVE